MINNSVGMIILKIKMKFELDGELWCIAIESQFENVESVEQVKFKKGKNKMKFNFGFQKQLFYSFLITITKFNSL